MPFTKGQIAWNKGRKCPWVSKRNKVMNRTLTHREANSRAQKGNQYGAANYASQPNEHHNDLCGGKLRPKDVTIMTRSEHTGFHQRLRVLNGTHNWLSERR